MIQNGFKCINLGQQLSEASSLGFKTDVFVEDGYVVINKVYPYAIEIERINTPEKLLNWIWHLSGKTWVDNKIIRDLITTVSDICGFDIYGRL